MIIVYMLSCYSLNRYRDKYHKLLLIQHTLFAQFFNFFDQPGKNKDDFVTRKWSTLPKVVSRRATTQPSNRKLFITWQLLLHRLGNCPSYKHLLSICFLCVTALCVTALYATVGSNQPKKETGQRMPTRLPKPFNSHERTWRIAVLLACWYECGTLESNTRPDFD